MIYDFLEGTKLKHLAIGSENSIIQSLSLHPFRDEILFANRRQVQLWSTADIEETMDS